MADFELKSHTENAIGKRRYRLFDEVHDPIGKRKIVVHPDLMFILRSEGSKVFQKLYFVEIDRGTEGLRVIQDKLTGYHLYQREKVFRKFGDFDDFRVMFQTTSAKRQKNMSKIADDFREHMEIWCTEHSLVTDQTILSSAIWETGQDEPQSILKS